MSHLAPSPVALPQGIPPEILAQSDALVRLRRDIHAHPEVAFTEHRTAQLVAGLLQDWGFAVHTGMGQTGVVGVMRKGRSDRAVGLRADMDALPMHEANTFAHASQYPGRMHGCGHDGHTAMLLGAAQYLAQHASFDGTVYLIFQPAEEAGGGALRMLDDGLLARFPMQAVFGLHNWPGLAAGDVATSPGPVMASSSEFTITLHGQGGHAAMPHHANDPVPVACQMVQAFQTIVSRNTRPLDAAVVSVTMLNASDANNIIADTCTLQGTVRTFSTDVLDMVQARMQAIVEHLASAFGMRAQMDFRREYPPTINTAPEAHLVQTVATALLGADRVHVQEPTMGAEDFSYLLQRVPGCYFFLGNGAEAPHQPRPLHTACYDFNDAILPIGAALWVQLVQQFLGSPTPSSTAIHP